MPAYNEAENIKQTIQQWYPIVDKIRSGGADCKLVIANDGSMDMAPLFCIYISMQSNMDRIIFSRQIVMDRQILMNFGKCGNIGRSMIFRLAIVYLDKMD